MDHCRPPRFLAPDYVLPFRRMSDGSWECSLHVDDFLGGTYTIVLLDGELKGRFHVERTYRDENGMLILETVAPFTTLARSIDEARRKATRHYIETRDRLLEARMIETKRGTPVEIVSARNEKMPDGETKKIATIRFLLTGKTTDRPVSDLVADDPREIAEAITNSKRTTETDEPKEKTMKTKKTAPVEKKTKKTTKKSGRTTYLVLGLSGTTFIRHLAKIGLDHDVAFYVFESMKTGMPASTFETQFSKGKKHEVDVSSIVDDGPAKIKALVAAYQKTQKTAASSVEGKATKKTKTATKISSKK